MPTIDRLLLEIEGRSSKLFERLARGDDAPPALALRLEGLLEAAALLGEPESALRELLDRQYRGVFGASLASRLGEDWQLEHPFPEIPALMRRAPVVPSTRE